MGDIFISYRRSDSGGHAGRLYDRLRKRVGAEHVFFDVSSIEGGEEWRESLQAHLDKCDVVVAVIGPEWFKACDAQGRLRLSNPDDVVRSELAEAVRRRKVLIPVLVGGATLPAPETLPADLPPVLREISAYQAMRIDHDEFEADAQRLEGRLAELLPGVEFHAEEEGVGKVALAFARRAAWPAGIAIVLTWATSLFFSHQELEALNGGELAYVFAIALVLTSLVFWFVRRLKVRFGRTSWRSP